MASGSTNNEAVKTRSLEQRESWDINNLRAKDARTVHVAALNAEEYPCLVAKPLVSLEK